MRAAGRGSLAVGAGLVAVTLVTAGVLWWIRPPAGALTTGQVLALLPAGSTLRSLVRVDLDGSAPLESAAVVLIPSFPGAPVSEYAEIVARYDRWRRRFEVIHRRALPAAIPVSVDGGPLFGTRDGVLFQGLTDAGRWSYRVVGAAGGRIGVVLEGVSTDRIRLADGLVIDRGERRALRWDGTRFVRQPLPAVSPTPPALVWRYSLRGGFVQARTDRVILATGQTLRLQQTGGGITPIILADSRLDVVENGFRARHPGAYSIRVLAPFTPPEGAFILTVLVPDTAP